MVFSALSGVHLTEEKKWSGCDVERGNVSVASVKEDRKMLALVKDAWAERAEGIKGIL